MRRCRQLRGGLLRAGPLEHPERPDHPGLDSAARLKAFDSSKVQTEES